MSSLRDWMLNAKLANGCTPLTPIARLCAPSVERGGGEGTWGRCSRRWSRRGRGPAEDWRQPRTCCSRRGWPVPRWPQNCFAR